MTRMNYILFHQWHQNLCKATECAIFKLCRNLKKQSSNLRSWDEKVPQAALILPSSHVAKCGNLCHYKGCWRSITPNWHLTCTGLFQKWKMGKNRILKFSFSIKPFFQRRRCSRRSVRSDVQLSCTETRFQKCSQSGKNGSKHPMFSISMAYNVILCKKVERNTQKLKIADFTM